MCLIHPLVNIEVPIGLFTSYILHLLLVQDHVIELIKPFRGSKTMWKVSVEASKALLDLEFYRHGINAALMLFIKYLEEEPSLRGLTLLCLEITVSSLVLALQVF